MQAIHRQNLALYLAEVRHKIHNWGQFDCMLLCIDWADKLTGSNWAGGIRGHYEDRKTAIKFARGLNGIEWLNSAGYTNITDATDAETYTPQDGDIWFQDFKSYYIGWIIFQGLAWGVTEEQGLIRVLPESITKDLGPTGYTNRFRHLGELNA